MAKIMGYLCALVFALFSASPALTQVSDNIEQRLTLLINAGAQDEARRVLAEATDDRAETLLLEGRIAKARGDLDSAEDLLRQALRQRSNDLRIRREFAHTLYINGKLSRAAFHLNRLLIRDPDPQLRRAYQNILNDIGRRRPLTWQTFFAIEPSTNVNRGASANSFSTALGDFDIAEDSQSESGVGIRVGLVAAVNLDFSPKVLSRVVLSYTNTSFLENGEFEFDRQSLLFLNRFGVGKTVWEISVFTNRETHEDDDDFLSYGAAVAARHFLNEKTRLSFLISGDERDFQEAPSRSGQFYFYSANIDYDVSPTLTVSGGLLFERSDARSETLAFDGKGLSLGLTKLWPRGIETSFTLFGGERKFDGIFPLTSVRRDDTYWGGAVQARFNRLDLYGFTPSVQCRYEKNESNIVLAEFDVLGCGLNFTRAF